MNNKRVLVIQPLRPEALQLFNERPDITYEVITDFSVENLLAHAKGDVTAITVRDAPLPVEVLEQVSGLRVISRHGVGYDNIPVDYCTGRDIPVTVVGDVNAISVAEHTFGLILGAARKSVQLDQAVRSGRFAARSQLLGVELNGSTLLLVGFGRIGREVAKRALSFGMQVLIFDPYADRANAVVGTFIDSLEEGLGRADIVSLHVPLVATTRNLIGETQIAQMKPGAILVNAARGGIVDETAVVKALRIRHLRAAAFDTFATEPLPVEHGLITSDNTILSPHAAALTEQSLIAMGLVTVRNAIAGIDGTLDPRLVVNPSALKGTHYASA